MTSTAIVQAEIERFLRSSDPEVLCITGDWGVGNTRAAAVNVALPTRAAPTIASVLQFRLSRDWLATLESLSFVLETADFWPLVTDCRGRFPPHQRTGPQAEYDVVYGPVSLWPQTMVIKDCDQISFHTPGAVAKLPSPVLFKKANDSDPTKTLF